MRSILSSGWQTVELVRSGDSSGAEGFTPMRDRVAAGTLLRTFARNPLNMVVMRRALSDEMGGQCVGRMRDGEVLDRLAGQVARDRIRVVPGRTLLRERFFAGTETQEKSAPSEAPPVKKVSPVSPVATPAVKSWIRFQVIDDATGKPVSGVTLTLKLPNGTSKTVTTNSGGQIEFTDLPAGTCDIEKMTDQSAWEVMQIA